MTTTTTPATNAAAATSLVAHQLGFLPTVRPFTSDDGTAAVAVSLCGLYGAGREMMLDEADWHHISETISPWWGVHRQGNIDYVTCSATIAIEIACRTSKARALFLGRYLANPAPDLFVRFVNGDHLDCRRANLAVVTRSEHSRANGAALRARKMQQWAETAAAVAAANEAAAVARGAA